VLNYVAKAISSSKHVRAAAFVDQELKFVPEENYPGVTHLREEINRAFGKSNLLSIPHAEAYPRLTTRERPFASYLSRQTRQSLTALYSCAWTAVT